MKVNEAREKVCPHLNKKCIIEECMFWKTIINGKKELDRKIVPYDMTRYDIIDWIREKEKDGYINIGRQGGFRDYYVKYEESYEGYCCLVESKKDIVKG